MPVTMTPNEQLAIRIGFLLGKLKDERLESEAQIRDEMNKISTGEKQISYLEGLIDGREDARFYLNSLVPAPEPEALDATTTNRCKSSPAHPSRARRAQASNYGPSHRLEDSCQP